jgi:UDP-N-acetyl-2-amino-2-deoxyglucuronate dehydrogenase
VASGLLPRAGSRSDWGRCAITTATARSPVDAPDRGEATAEWRWLWENRALPHGHPLYYDNVIKVLRGEAEPETDGREGLKSLEVLIATYLSARDGRRVALPLDY